MPVELTSSPRRVVEKRAGGVTRDARDGGGRRFLPPLTDPPVELSVAPALAVPPPRGVSSMLH
jgi:hypothetical protein